MFSFIGIDYRAGISVKGENGTRHYTLDFFMQAFVNFWKLKSEEVKVSNEGGQIDAFNFTSPYMLWEASQLLPQGNVTLEDFDLSDQNSYISYTINGREVICPKNSNCYMIDAQLIGDHPDYFDRGYEISYLMLSRFMATSNFNGSDLATAAIAILNGVPVPNRCPEVDVMPVLLSALLLAEPCRRPSLFLPTLMAIDLIVNRIRNPIGSLYTWENCIQNEQLHLQRTEAQYKDLMASIVTPRLTGMPTPADMESGAKTSMTNRQADEYNADKKYNRKKNQRGEKKVMPHEIAMQAGGYFPATHRFSYTEISKKDEEDIRTLSDKKSFILIVDFLSMLNLASPIHRYDICRYRNIDTDTAFLTNSLFPFFYEMLRRAHPSDGLLGLKRIPERHEAAHPSTAAYEVGAIGSPREPDELSSACELYIALTSPNR